MMEVIAFISRKINCEAYGVNGKPLTYRNITALASPLRGVFTLTKGQWGLFFIFNVF